MPSWSFVANLCIYANHYYELCIYTYYHIIILYSDDGSGNCRNMSVLKLRSVIISVKFIFLLRMRMRVVLNFESSRFSSTWVGLLAPHSTLLICPGLGPAEDWSIKPSLVISGT